MAISLARPDVDFLITNACPNGCQHCVFDSGQPLADEMDTAEVLGALHSIRKLFGIQWISLSGGEPLARPDFAEIYLEASKLFRVTLISTGAGLTDQVRQRLREHPPGQAIVSLYGLHEDHDRFSGRPGAFGLAIRYLEFLKELKASGSTNVSVNIVCHRSNAAKVSAIIAYLFTLDVTDEIKLLTLSPVGRGSHLLKECLGGREWISWIADLQAILMENSSWPGKSIRVERHVAEARLEGHRVPGCYVVRDAPGVFSSCVHIDADGLIYPCTMLVRCKSFCLGSIREDAALDLGSYYTTLRAAETEVLERNCRSCARRGACLGGCFGYHLAVGRDYRCLDGDIVSGCPDRYEPLDGCSEPYDTT